MRTWVFWGWAVFVLPLERSLDYCKNGEQLAFMPGYGGGGGKGGGQASGLDVGAPRQRGAGSEMWKQDEGISPGL